MHHPLPVSDWSCFFKYFFTSVRKFRYKGSDSWINFLTEGHRISRYSWAMMFLNLTHSERDFIRSLSKPATRETDATSSLYVSGRGMSSATRIILEISIEELIIFSIHRSTSLLVDLCSRYVSQERVRKFAKSSSSLSRNVTCLMSLSLVSLAKPCPFFVFAYDELSEIFRNVRCNFEEIKIEIPILDNQRNPLDGAHGHCGGNPV